MDSQTGSRLFISTRIRVHPTWYLAIILIAGILVTQYPGNYPLRDRIFLGLSGGLLFLASMTIVQVLANLAANLMRIPVRNAMVFVFGGVGQVPEDSTSPGQEAATAGIALLLNFVMAVVFNWLFLSRTDADSPVIVLLLQWLAFFWYILALFHLLPAYPLVGGRILAAVMWKVTGQHLRSLRKAANVGWCFGLALVLSGVALLLFSDQWTNGVMLTFFGWALQGAATFGGRRAALLGALQDTRAKDVMTKIFTIVTADLTLDKLVSDHMLVTGQDLLVVADQEELLGIVTSRNIRRVPRNRWAVTPVREIMTPRKTARTVSGGRTAAHALEAMDHLQVDQLPVFEDGSMTGVVARESLLRLAKIRGQLKV
jgi:predicted transcriptional regulator/Zn-dependent protease